MCDLGVRGWKLGRIIAMNYRESHWEIDEYAPYQVALEDDYSLIYVPLDDDRYCREALAEDLRIIGRAPAAASLGLCRIGSKVRPTCALNTDPHLRCPPSLLA